MTANVLNTKVNSVENKILNHDKYINTPEFNELTAGSFSARLMEAGLMAKTNFDNKRTSFNRWITSNKTKHLEVQKKLNSLITKDFLGSIDFTSNDGSQNTFVYQPTFNVVELKKTRVLLNM